MRFVKKGSLKSVGKYKNEYKHYTLKPINKWEREVVGYYKVKDIRQGCWLGTWKDGFDTICLLDYRITDSHFWKGTFRTIRSKCADGYKRDELIDKIKKDRYYTRLPKAPDWQDVLPLEVVKWAYEVIGGAMSNEPCVDNHRCALKSDRTQVRRYKKQQESGCCGFYDKELIGPDGKTYLVGCNYGH